MNFIKLRPISLAIALLVGIIYIVFLLNPLILTKEDRLNDSLNRFFIAVILLPILVFSYTLMVGSKEIELKRSKIKIQLLLFSFCIFCLINVFRNISDLKSNSIDWGLYVITIIGGIASFFLILISRRFSRSNILGIMAQSIIFYFAPLIGGILLTFIYLKLLYIVTLLF